MLRVIALAALLGAVGAPSATTAPTIVRWFHSPSGNIQCEVGANRLQLGTYAFCATIEPARCVRMNGNAQMRVRSGLTCQGNAPETSLALAYGRSVRVGPFRCTSRTDGMRCLVVATQHGFLISRARVKRI